MATTLESFTAGAETSVDVAGIERQLRELWQLAAESGTEHQISRASLFNFVAYSETDAARDHAVEVVTALTGRHPCRAIVLLAKVEESADELSASITAHCHLAGGGRKQVCCEQISIFASGKGVAQLGATVLPLLESDLPTVLWWNGNFLGRPDLFRRLGAVSDRVLFDSSSWPSPRAELAGLAKLIDGQARTDFADLSWTRLALWRRLAAEAFEEPRAQEALPGIRQIRVAHGRGQGAELRALLLGSWVAAQLSWTAEAAREQIQFEVSPDPEAPAMGVMKLTLIGENFEMCVCKQHGESTASATVTMPDACGLPRKRAFWPCDDVALLSQELDHNQPHKVYRRALEMAAAVIRG